MSEWKTKPLGELTTLLKDGTHGSYADCENGVPLLSAKDIEKGHVQVPDDCRRISEEAYKSIHTTYVLEEFDVLLTIVGTIGRAALFPKRDNKVTFQRSVAIIRTNRKKLWPEYCYHYVNSFNFQQYLESYKNASAQGGVYLGALNKIPIFSPASLAEQRKIARILSTVDEVIEKTEAAIAKYKAIKAGMMRDLFTRGIELKTGKLRPSYEEAPELYKESELGWVPKEWEVVRLKSVIINHHSGIYKNSSLYGEGYNIVGVSDLYYHDSINGQIFRQVPLTQTEKDNFTLNEGDLIYGESSLVLDGIAKALWVTVKGAGTVFAWHTRRMKIDRTKVLPQYLYFLLASTKTRAYIMSVATQTALTGITTKDYFKTPVSIPKPNEQEEIEKRLHAIDVLIQSEVVNNTKQKNLKSALMSDLLTGKVRVKYEEIEKVEVM